MNTRKKTVSAREISFLILLEFETKNSRLDGLISHAFESYSVSDREKKLVMTLTHGVIRNRSLLDWRLSAIYHGDWKKALQKFKTILRLAAFETDALDFIPPRATIHEYVNLAKKRLNIKMAGTVNGVMRNYLRQRKQLDPSKRFKYPAKQIELKYSVPAWLVERWIDLWGVEDTEKMCAAFNERPLFDLKINEMALQRREFEELLEENGIFYQRSQYFPDIVKVSDIQNVRKLKVFDRGFCIVQDESARLAVEMLEITDNDVLLDACAAPGGKLIVLHQLSGGKLKPVAMDADSGRLRSVIQMCTRQGIDCRVVCGDGRFPPLKTKFDKILVDAPCSGFGTLQKNPDIKWRRQPEDLPAFHSLQTGILAGVADLLKEGGLLVYSTCTIDPTENEEVIEEFLQASAGRFITVPPPPSLSEFASEGHAIRTFPHIHQTDGAYAVRLMLKSVP